MTELPPEPGAPVRIRFEKYGGRPHWVSGAGPLHLGADEWGQWFGWPEGTHFARPGLEFDSSGLQIGCYPHDRWHSVAFHAPHSRIRLRLYIDVATPARWRHGPDGLPEITCTALDLDVIERTGGEIILDDEDEFLEHSELFGYPDDLIDGARREADLLMAEVADGPPRFSEELAESWRETFHRLR